jgi:hypothetical protein
MKVEPNSVEEAIAAWDSGHEVQTVEMGGLGDAYEMAIQCVAFEIMRALIADKRLHAIVTDTPVGQAYPHELLDFMDDVATNADAKDAETGTYKLGGLSGAQVSAAQHLAMNLIRNGWGSAREKVPERLIFVRKQDPVAMFKEEKAK